MEHQVRKTLVTVAIAATAFWANGALAATPAQKCQAGKNNVAGKYAACRHKAEAKFATTLDGAARTTALSKCTMKYADAWQKLETNASGACPSNGDEIGVENVVNREWLHFEYCDRRRWRGFVGLSSGSHAVQRRSRDLPGRTFGCG